MNSDIRVLTNDEMNFVSGAEGVVVGSQTPYTGPGSGLFWTEVKNLATWGVGVITSVLTAPFR